MDNSVNISKELIKDFERVYAEKPKSRVLANAIIKNGIENTAINRESIVNMQYTFSEDIETLKITDQKQSGRCWLFAGLNTLRYRIFKSLKLKDDFELSQSYLMFWDKVEKANFFLESILECADESTDSRLMMWLLESPMNDAGQWDMFVNLVRKYGVVPKYVMPETFHSSNTGRMNSLLNLKLREFAVRIRRMHSDGKPVEELRAGKNEMLKEFYSILCHFMGEPPREFVFEYRDADKNFHRHTFESPLDFFREYIGEEVLDEYVSIINAPTKDKPFNNVYTVKYLGNVKGGRDILYLNLEMSELKKLAAQQIKDGEPVWFGSDIGKMTDRELGIMDTALYDYGDVLNTKFNLSKGEMLNYRESCLTHAMVLTGVNLNEDNADRWKVENSWGTGRGSNGFFVMSDEWFDRYVYQVVIRRKYLSKESKKALDKKVIELEPWDPMGSLAAME